jgi:hypothetical protein
VMIVVGEVAAQAGAQSGHLGEDQAYGPARSHG